MFFSLLFSELESEAKYYELGKIVRTIVKRILHDLGIGIEIFKVDK